MVLLCKSGLDDFLGLRQRQTGNHHGSGIGKRHSTLAIDRPADPLRNTSPNVDGNRVPRTQDIVGAGRQIHGKLVHTDNIGTKDVRSKAPQRLGLLGKLGVQISRGWKTGIGIGLRYGPGVQRRIIVRPFRRRGAELRRSLPGSSSRRSASEFFRNLGICLGTQQGPGVVFGNISQLNQRPDSFCPKRQVVLHAIVHRLVRDRLLIDQTSFCPQPLH